MNVLTLALLMSSAAAGGIINTVCGFGLGAVAMSVWPYLMPYMQSVSVVTLCGLTIDLLLLSNTYRFISWKKLTPCLICGMLFSSLSVYLSVGAAEKALVRSLGVILIALGIYSVFFSGRIRIKASPFNGCIAGALAGAFSGLFSVGGPPVAIYLLVGTDSNSEYRATLNAYFCFINVSTTWARWRNGIITAQVLQVWLLLAGAVGLSIFVGNKVFYKLNGAKLRKIVYAYLIFSGALLLFR